jgi:hypothetical protein
MCCARVKGCFKPFLDEGDGTTPGGEHNDVIQVLQKCHKRCKGVTFLDEGDGTTPRGEHNDVTQVLQKCHKRCKGVTFLDEGDGTTP